MTTYYYFEGLVNDDGVQFGLRRHVVAGETYADALDALTRYFRTQAARELMGAEFAADIRYATPETAAHMRLTTNSGDDPDGAIWGWQSSDVWSQQLHGDKIS